MFLFAQPSTKLLQFRKRHYGAFTNEIAYKGILLPSSAHTTARFEGVYDQGTIELAKTSPISVGIPMLLSGRYSASCRFDGISQDWDELQLTIMGRSEAASPVYKDSPVQNRVFQLSGSGMAYDTSTTENSNKPVRNTVTASEIMLAGNVDPVTLRVDSGAAGI